MSHKHEYLLGPGDRVRFQRQACECYKPHVAKMLLALRGTIVETDDEARECDYHRVEWDDQSLNFEEIFNLTSPLNLELDEFLQGDDLEPAGDDDNSLLDRHSDAERKVLEEAVTALYLYGGCRGIRGAFYDIVRALDTEMSAELEDEGPDWVFAKYFREE